MTVNDPGTPRTTEVKQTYGGASPDPTIIHTTEVRESNAAWWIGALVAIVAILAVVYLVTRPPATNPDDLATALEQGRMQGALESTQANLSAAQESANLAAQRAADATARAADSAALATERATEAAASASERVSDVVVPPLEPVN